MSVYTCPYINNIATGIICNTVFSMSTGIASGVDMGNTLLK